MTVERFRQAAENVGTAVVPVADIGDACRYIAGRCDGPVLLPSQPSLERGGLSAELEQQVKLLTAFDKSAAEQAAAGISGANFGIAETGTIVLESSAEPVRLATTLPPKHFVLIDPAKIVADGRAAVPYLQNLHHLAPQSFIAYITGPSRTADIERVLTIGVHGPKELHILLLDNLSSDFMES
ncbi:MAG: hypothetical protein C0615_11415 [Desulfuromonas sp.]|nr:MAG: hypothetical protein C0615_11415 [Desulfuromonas sp.]